MRSWLASRTALVDSSGIRKVFDLAAKMKNPINLSIGQPDFPVPDEVKRAAMEAIEGDKNGYSLTQGIPALREKLQARIDAELGHADRKVLVTSGTSGALALVLLALVDPGDEVICFDPYFVMYPALVGMVGGKCVLIDTYPDFRIDVDRVAAAITPRTKLILLNSPANPTGVVASADEVRGLAELAAEHNVALLSDEIYREFCYAPKGVRTIFSNGRFAANDKAENSSDPFFVSPTRWNEHTIVVDGFSKSHAVTGWRLGFVHGPSEIIDKLTALQQYTFVCAPHPLQWGAVAAMEVDMSSQVASYRQKRDRIVGGLLSAGYQVTPPGGAFYVFPKAPRGTGSDFVARAIENELLIIPGNIFSSRDTHFRISYAASDETIDRGLEVLERLAKSVS